MKKTRLNIVAATSASLLLSACGGSSGDTSNQAPVFTTTQNQFTLAEDTSLTGQFKATDTDSDQIAFGVGNIPKNGTLTVNRDGGFVYTPKENYFGEDNAIVVVSDSIETVTKEIKFVIDNINDAPIIIDSHVVISEIGKATGQIVAIDHDNDTLKYAILNQANKGVITLNADTGSFSYTSNIETQIDDSFVVSVSDGKSEATQATIALIPSFNTSDDKRRYYYTSEHSHLAQATKLIESNEESDVVTITDAALSDQGYAHIAVGYAQSGFIETAVATVEKKILSQTIKAHTYRSIALELDSQQNTPLANVQRDKASAEYNAYIAEIGLENIGSSDALFYLTLIKDFLLVDQNEQATKLLEVTALYIKALSNPKVESTTAHRALVGAYVTHAKNIIEDLINGASGIDFNKAYQSVKNLSDIIETVSFNETSRGTYHNYRANYYRETAQLAHILSLTALDDDKQKATDLAKLNLARGLALYTDISYDPNYQIKADQYAATTLERFDFPLATFSGLFASLYPDYVLTNKTESNSGNIAFELLKPVGSASDIRFANRHMLAHALLVDAQKGRAFDATLSQIHSVFSGGDEAEIYHVLVENGTVNASERYAAWMLHYAGFKEEALQLIDEAEKVVMSKAYQDDVKLVVSQVVESHGCVRLADLNTLFGGNYERSHAILKTCDNIVDTQYTNNKTISNDRKVHALNTMVNAWANANEPEKALLSSASAQEIAATITEFDDYAEEHLNIARALAFKGFLNESMQAASKAFNTLNSELDSANSAEALVDTIDDVFTQLESITDRSEQNLGYSKTPYLRVAIAKHAGTHQDYVSVMTDMHTQTSNLLLKIQTLTQTLSENDQQDIFKELIEHYAAIGEYSQAQNLALSTVYTNADKEQQLLNIVKHQATHDDFPATPIANIDTDKDGLVNFFLPKVSQQQINASGLTLDADSDNDGLTDQEDLMPLSVN